MSRTFDPPTDSAAPSRLSAEKRRLLELMLAERQAEKAARRRVARAEIETVDRSAPLHLSYAQQRLWFLDQLAPGNPAYNIPAAVRLTGALDGATLQRGLQVLMARHENLRTTFVAPDGEPSMHIHEHVELPLERLDFSHLPHVDALEAAQDRVPQITNRPFDLQAGPLVRVALMRLAENDHVLLVIMHHVISDVWSFGIFFQELGAVYDALIAGEEPSLPPLPFHYADYAAWQRRVLEGGEQARQLAFWKQQLDGAPLVLDLPTDRPRPARQRFFGGRVPLVIGGGVHDAIRELARAEDATPYMANLTILAILLRRLTGQDDLLIGTPVTNRNRTELEAQIGFYVNSLAIRVDLSGEPTFRQLLRRVRDRCLPAFEHRDLPFERLVQELEVERDMSRNPIYQVDFAFQNFPKPYLKTPGLTLSPFETREAAARVDLEFDLKESHDGFEGFIRFNSDLFDPSTVERFAARFEKLLRAVLADPDRPIDRLALFTAEELAAIEAFSDTERAFDEGELPIHRLVQRQVERTPDAMALVTYDGVTLSFRELARRAHGLAHRLRAEGVGFEDRCGVCLERSAELIVALLAVLEAGAAYVPVDPDYPRERLRFLIEDSRMRAIVASGATADAVGLDELLPNVPLLRVDAASLAAGAADAPPELLGQRIDHLAYVIYTSGSTGRPKGAMNEHRGPVNSLLWARDDFALEPGDRMLQKTPISFDVSVWEIFLPLISGACLVVARPGDEGDPARLAQLIDEHGATVMLSVPSMLQAFVEAVPDGSCSSLRLVALSGEPLTFDLQRRFYARFDALLENVYGPTEAAVEVTSWKCRRDQVTGPVPIGSPITNLHIHVVDDAFRAVGLGVPGELLIAGVGVGRGYHARPSLTADRFVPDPFAATPGARLYRSGDKARWCADGTLEFFGRLDHQVKIRGFRIELGEIESTLADHPDVREAAALVREIAGAPALVGYVVPNDATTLDLDTVREHLARTLPELMVPAAWVVLDVFPLTPSGKLDRRALPDPRVEAEAWVEPDGATEETLAAIWREILGAERVGAADHFFSLGGQSLLATQVVARIRDALEIELPLRVLFEKPVLRQLAAAVDRAVVAADTARRAPAMELVDRDGPLPLSFAQERLWFIDRLVPELAAYNIPGAVRMTGDLEPELLEAALGRVVDRHEVLRTTFHSGSDGPVQIVAPPSGERWPIPRLDLRDRPRAERHAEALRRADTLSGRSFDLDAGPLMHGLLIRLDERDWLFVLIIHHIVYDMWSREIFLRELVASYEALRRGGEPELPELPLQYADFATWQRAWLRGEVLDEQLRYWRRELDGIEPLELPADHPRPQVQTFAGKRLHFALGRDLTERLKHLGQRHDVTLFVALLAGFALVLERYTGRRDLPVGSPVANRNRSEIEGLMGFFANTLVLRVRLTPTMTVAELLRHVQDVTLGAYAHQDLPFEKLVGELQPDRDLSRQPLFQVLFNYLVNYAPPAIELPGLRLDPEQIHGGGVPFDLTLSLFEVDGALHSTVDYATDLFVEATMARFFEHYRNVLDGLARCLDGDLGGDLPIDAVEALTADERRWILDAVEPAPEPAAGTVADRVARIADEHPDAVALVGRDARGERVEATYAELIDRADRLAGHLLALGVAPGEPVALALERTTDLPIAVLAVLRAGGSYLPLDPSAPRERLDVLVEDARARVVLTTSKRVDRFGDLVGADGQVVEMDRLGALPRPTTLPRVDPESTAYVLFTSGSTGRPKGVALPHRATTNLVDWLVTDLAADGRARGPRTLQFASIGFDVSFQEIASTWASGGSLHLLAEDERRDLRAVLRRLADERIERVVLPAVALHELARLATAPDAPRLFLERIATSGEALQVTDALRAFATRLADGLPAGRELVFDNEYGPSETHVVSRHRLGGDPAAWPTWPPIGRAIPGARLHVLDRRGEPVPPGAAGELLVGGAAPARGYAHRPALTAEAFVPDPFSPTPGDRLYRTGDLVRRRADGVLDFLGRIDDQVKIRGHRVEPGEVRAILDRHPAVRACAVIARRDGDGGGARLIAYVVAETTSDAASDVGALRAYLGDRLPEYMVPSAFVPLDALPTNASGKLDRRALPEPNAERPDLAQRFVAPDTEIERALAAIWRDVLGVETVGVDDSFFDLGGHSLLATQVVVRVAETFEVELPLRQIFDRPTIGHLASAIEAVRWVSAGDDALDTASDTPDDETEEGEI